VGVYTYERQAVHFSRRGNGGSTVQDLATSVGNRKQTQPPTTQLGPTYI